MKTNFDLEYVNCNLCGRSSTKLYATVSYADCLNRRPRLKQDDDPIFKNKKLANYKFSLVKCKNCGLVYVNPRLSSESLAKLYQQEYFSKYVDTKSEAHQKRSETFKVEIAELERLIKKLKIKRKILDVGCGGGFFLASLNNLWEKYGIEINPNGVRYGRVAFGINILKGTLKEVNFPDEKFDVVKMRGVIEHLPDPINELREIYRILSKRSLLAINTPNIGSICGKIYREKFRMVSPLHHIYYFSGKTLFHMLEKVGFKIWKISYHYFDTPYASWRDPLKIFCDLVSLKVFREPYTVSPPFYGNVMDIYAAKGLSK